MFKFSYPLTDKNLNNEHLWELYSAIFEIDIPEEEATENPNGAPLFDFSHVQASQLLLRSANARRWWLALPERSRDLQRLFLARRIPLISRLKDSVNV